MAHVKLKGASVTLKQEFIKVGSTAPQFTLIDQQLKECSLKDLGKKKKLLYIVPSLDTEVCLLSTKHLNTIAKEHSHVQIVVISADLPFAQKRACGIEKLDNIKTLSMMKDKAFAQDYGVLIADGPLAGLCARAVVVLDENNKVLYTQLVSEITEEPKYEPTLAALKA
jgi:thioredoxin-dependent peroxiredoxin